MAKDIMITTQEVVRTKVMRVHSPRFQGCLQSALGSKSRAGKFGENSDFDKRKRSSFLNRQSDASGKALKFGKSKKPNFKKVGTGGSDEYSI